MADLNVIFDSDSEDDADFFGFTAEEIASAERISNSIIHITYSDIEIDSDDSYFTGDSDSESETELEVEELRPQAANWEEPNPNANGKKAFCGPTPGPVANMDNLETELDFLNLFFPDTLYEHIACETSRYASVKLGHQNWSTTGAEIKTYMGMRIFMSVVQLATQDMYWSTDWMFGGMFLPKVMTRDRFDKISEYLHVSDNSRNPPKGTEGHDKVAHCRTIIDKVRANCISQYRPHQNVSIDEAMIAFRGRLGWRQYVPAKPTKYGMKVWVRADPHNGYVNDFQIYTGKADDRRVEHGLGGRVVLDLCDTIEDKNHIVNCDSFFTSPDLFTTLISKGIYARGTIKKNRKGFPKDRLKDKSLKVQGESKMLQKEEMVALKWKDKRVISLISTADQPVLSSVKRRSKDGTSKQVTCPIAVENYNKYMNGVDRADQVRTELCTYRKARRWWLYVFWFLFDLSIANALALFKESPRHMKHSANGKHIQHSMLEFRKNLAKQLIGSTRFSRKRSVPSTCDPNGTSHFPKGVDCRGRCKECAKKRVRSEPKIICTSCDIHLCINCFIPYHKSLSKVTETEE